MGAAVFAKPVGESAVKHRREFQSTLCRAVLPGEAWRLKGPQGMETVRVSGSLSSSNSEIVHQWAVDGHGIILRSTWDIAEDLREGRLVPVLPEYLQEANISAVYPLRLTESAKVRVCIEFLQQWLRDKG